jgi:hypothetical protein
LRKFEYLAWLLLLVVNETDVNLIWLSSFLTGGLTLEVDLSREALSASTINVALLSEFGTFSLQKFT